MLVFKFGVCAYVNMFYVFECRQPLCKSEDLCKPQVLLLPTLHFVWDRVSICWYICWLRSFWEGILPTEALRLKMYDLALWGLWEFKFRCSCHEVSTLNHLLIVCMWACMNVCVHMPWHACGSWRTTYGHQFCLSTTACARGIGLRPSGFTCWATSAGLCLFFKSTAELRLKVQTCNPSF